MRGNRDMWQGSGVCRWGRRERIETFPPLFTALDKRGKSLNWSDLSILPYSFKG